MLLKIPGHPSGKVENFPKLPYNKKDVIYITE